MTEKKINAEQYSKQNIEESVITFTVQDVVRRRCCVFYKPLAGRLLVVIY